MTAPAPVPAVPPWLALERLDTALESLTRAAAGVNAAADLARSAGINPGWVDRRCRTSLLDARRSPTPTTTGAR